MQNPTHATYLNHAGTSWPKPPSVWAAHDEARDAPPDRWPALFDAAHRTVATAFGTVPERLHITPGCTQALEAAVMAVPWRAGDHVVTSGLEHEALMRPLRALQARGVETIAVGRAGVEPLDLEALDRALSGRRVQLVAMSMASNVTGEALPWRHVLQRAAAVGAWCLLDAAQVAGWVPLDLPALGADFVAFAGHKGPQAPTGVGGLYVRRERPHPSWCDTGSVALPALCGLAAGLTWLRDVPPLDRALALQQQVRQAVGTLPGVRIVGGSPVVPTLSIRIGSEAPSETARRLAAKGVIVNGSQHCAPSAHRTLGTAPTGTLRLSFGPSSTEDDALTAIEALSTLSFESG